MWIEPDRDQTALVAEVDAVLGAGRGAELLAQLRAEGAAADPRPLFEHLGEHRLLAVHWPERLGGRGMRMLDHAAVAERFGQLGVPDVAHLVTIQAVGSTLLIAGSPEQREEIAPRLARGEALASLLYSEPHAGSDLAALRTQAEPAGSDGEYRLWGEKTWNPYTPWSEFALCTARTRSDTSPYNGITLFLVGLGGEGVEISPLDTISPDPLHRIAFSGTPVGTANVVGRLHGAWSLLLRSISLERAGFDYLSRAHRWLPSRSAVVAGAREDRRASVEAEALSLAEQLADARGLSYAAAASAATASEDGLEMDENACALAKIAASEVAQRIAWWVHEVEVGRHDPRLEDLAEAAGLSVSGGPTEALFDAIAAELSTEEAREEPGAAGNGRTPVLRRRLREALEDPAAGEDGLAALYEEFGWALCDDPLALEAADDAARIRHAAFLTGVARRAQSLAVAYAQSRVLGGRLLIERQAVAHRLARASLRLALGKVRLRRALHGGEPPASCAVLANAIELALLGSRDAMQVHGAAGLAEPRVVRAFEVANGAAYRLGAPATLWEEAVCRPARAEDPT